MDERIDMSRSVRDKEYRYTRNYMPHKIYAQYLEYLWRAPSMPSWEKAYWSGELNEIQSKFWETKPVEELYDVEADPHNIRNLAADPQYRSVLERMRSANEQWMLDTKDVGFMPEAMMEEVAETTTLYEYARSGKYPLKEIMQTVESVTYGDMQHIIQSLEAENPVERFWAATACTLHADKATPAKDLLKTLAEDPETSVRIAAAEALYHLGDKEMAVQTLSQALQKGNLMARVQALNVLETMDADAVPALPAVKSIIPDDPDNRSYDVRAAKRLVEKLENN
jgi:hypothetical protein